MTEGRLAWASGAHPSPHASFLGWKDLEESGGKKAGAKQRDSDEDAKSWAGFERKRRQTFAKEHRKGPAFWNKTVNVMEQQKHRALPFRGSGLILPDGKYGTLAEGMPTQDGSPQGAGHGVGIFQHLPRCHCPRFASLSVFFFFFA